MKPFFAIPALLSLVLSATTSIAAGLDLKKVSSGDPVALRASTLSSEISGPNSRTNR